VLPARWASAAPVSIWYRTTDGCPNADAFVGRLATQGVEARIARVGDHIDFVVTLGQEAGQSLATLERQSAERTVSIREVHAATCDAAANALALTLALTVDPEATTSAPVSAQPAVATTAAVIPPPSAEPPPATTAAREPPPKDAGSTTEAVAPDAHTTRFTLGLQGSVGTLVSGAPLWGGNVFAAVASRRGLRPSARVSFATGVQSGPVEDVTLSLYAGRLEGCPAELGRTVSVSGCAALDVGVLRASSRASGGESDSSFWGALWGLGRVRYAPTESPWTAEIQGGLTAALTRYRVASGSPPETLAEVKPWGVGLAAGAGVRLP